MSKSTEQNAFNPKINYKYHTPEITLAAINLIDSVIEITSDVDVVLDQLMDAVLGIFNCSRAWLFHPCNPELPSFDVAFESTTPEYPGANALKQQVPMTDDMADYCRRALSAIDGPEIDPPEGLPVTNDIAIRFNVKSMLFMALRPKSGEPWMFGLHQCDRDRVWTSDDKQLFHMIGKRITGCIDNLLFVRQLKESESLLNYSQKLASIGSFVWDLDSDDLHWSSNMYHIHGVEENIFKKNLTKLSQELIHPDDQSHIRNEIERMIQAGHVWSMEFRIIRADGEERIMRSSGEFTLDKNGKPSKCIGVHQDITEQKKNEEALRNEEEKFRMIVENTVDWVWQVDSNGRYTYVSPQAKALMGYDVDEFYGKTPFDFMSAVEAEIVAPIFAEAVERGERILGLEDTLLAKDGSKVIFETNATPIFGQKGDIKGYMGTCRDITQRKLADEILRESEAKYRWLLETLNEGIWSLDENGYTNYVNDKMAEILGYNKDEMEGKHLYYFMDEEWKGIAENNLKKRKMGVAEQHEFSFLKKDGGSVYVLMNTSPIIDNDGNYLGALAGVIDITEQKRAEIERLNLETKLRQAQKMESIGTLAGGIAHDFNNILSAIMGFTEMVDADLPEGSRNKEDLGEVIHACKRARDLVKQILTFSRQSDFESRPLRIELIAKEALKMIRSSTPTSIEIRQNIPSDIPVVIADSTQINQIIMNLCTNAVHAMEDEHGTISVSLEAVKLDDLLFDENPDGVLAGEYVRLMVNDTGKGMPPELQERIFEPYFTTKKAGEGTGLGLSVVYGIVKETGGTITVESEVGKGTTFSVLLPVAEKSESEQATNQQSRLPWGKERILFIDDEPSIASLGRKSLERFGYDVTIRQSSLEALELFRNDPQRFDVVVTDMTMPHVTGDELAREILSIRSDIPIVLCTGYSKRISDKQAKEIGISAFVMKPLTAQELASTVRRVLDEK